MVICKKDLNNEKNVGKIYENELQKKNQTEFRVEKVIMTQGDKLHFKLRGFDNSCSSWIDAKDIITKNRLVSGIK